MMTELEFARKFREMIGVDKKREILDLFVEASERTLVELVKNKPDAVDVVGEILAVAVEKAEKILAAPLESRESFRKRLLAGQVRGGHISPEQAYLARVLAGAA